MRQIGTVTAESDRQRITDYLLTLGIKTQSEPAAEGFILWAFDEDRISEARQVVGEFLADPSDQRYDSAAKEAANLRHQAAAAVRRSRALVQRFDDGWRHTARRPGVTLVLIFLSILVTALTRMGSPIAEEVAIDQVEARLSEAPNLLVQRVVFTRFYDVAGTNSYFYPALFEPNSPLLAGELWRLVTPAFLHFSLIHILFNSTSFYSVGSLLEKRYGSPWLLWFFLVSAIGSNLVQYLMDGPRFGGLSGVVFAVFGFAWIRGKCDLSAGFRLHPKSVFMMIFWLLICTTGAAGPIANGAHFAGFLIGGAWGYLPRLRATMRS